MKIKKVDVRDVLLMILFSCWGLPVGAFKNIESSKKHIAALLQKNSPASLQEFNQFCSRYDQTVINFFNIHNNIPMTDHVSHMEKELVTLQLVACDLQFASVRAELDEVNNELQSLITVLKKYRSSKNSIGLALKVRRFKKLLPYPINKWTDFSLFWSLCHRLNC